MELNKFEKHAREKLEDRRIEPAAGTWKKLDAKLNAQENKPGQVSWRYMVAAVSILLILGAVMWNREYSQPPQVVEEPVKKTLEKPDIKQHIQAVGKQIASEDNKNKEELPEKNNSKPEIAEHMEISVKEEKASEVPEPKKRNFNHAIVLETMNLAPVVSKEELVRFELEEVIAAAGKNDKISDEEVEVLLARAAASISRERNTPSYSAKILLSADALLAEVEDEIYQSFKEKIFEVLKEGYLKAKTAVANSN